MRIWLDPAKLNSFQMTTKDVTDAIESQNAQIAVGQLGGTPSVDKQALNATINAQSLLQTPQQFRDITLRVNQDGSEVKLGDVATVELGAEKYDYLSRFNGNPASGLGVKLASGANEMATAKLVLDRLNELAQYFPHGLEYKIAYETTSFVKASIIDVVKTLLEAIALVFLVMYLFLQNFRATLIPTIAVPVVLMGTFSVLYAFGYSINTLTMFAMVLAIGLLVDDAIVVVENVERIMSEEGLTPREATRKSMGQIQGAGRYRDGAVCGIRADGVLWRYHRGDLSSVFYYHCLGNGAVGAGRHDPDASVVRNVIKTAAQRRAARATRIFRLV